jgi:hypothetical protein
VRAIDLFKPALVLVSILVFPIAACAAGNTPSPEKTEAKTYRLFTRSALRQAPEGQVVDIWESGTPFTSNITAGNWIRVTGQFLDGGWRKNSRPLWVRREYTTVVPERHSDGGSGESGDGIDRYIVIDKNTFELQVFEKRPEGDKAVFSTRVALGMDRCLPKSKGGRCYFTEPGDYQVRWKVHDAKGIQWCIPGFMEKEYSRDVAAGRRCFRGPLGYYALNIGKSYAIHGTNHPEKLGRKVSHGCVRAANGPMKKLFSLMDVGDPVYIRE